MFIPLAAILRIYMLPAPPREKKGNWPRTHMADVCAHHICAGPNRVCAARPRSRGAGALLSLPSQR